MNTPTLPSAGGASGKSFWSKPEGKWAIGINCLIGAAILYFWGSIVAFLLEAAVDTLHLIVVCAAIAAILFVLFDGNFRRMMWYLYRSVMRWITGMFVAIDPIGILKTNQEGMKAKKVELDESSGEIRGQRLKLSRQLEKNTADYESSMGKLSTAQSQLQSPDPRLRHQADRIITLEARQSQRLETLIVQQRGHMAHYDDVVAEMARIAEICEDAILDYGREIDSRKQAQDAANSFRKGMRAAGAILRGMPDQEESDMAIEYLEQHYTQAMGEAENILSLTKNVVAAADFNDQAAITSASAKVEQWKAGKAVQELASPEVKPTDKAFDKYFK